MSHSGAARAAIDENRPFFHSRSCGFSRRRCLVVAVLVIRRTESSSDVLRGGYIERDSDTD